MSQNEFPAGWDQNRVSSLIAHYDDKSEDEAVAECNGERYLVFQGAFS